jgi:glycosyltransferase involved in cell wall biosynthesis
MKIVHVIGYFQPDLGYEEFYTAKNQAKDGHDVHVVCSDLIVRIDKSTKRDRHVDVKYEVRDGIHIHRLNSLELYTDMVILQGLKNKLKELNPDVVHAHTIVQFPSIISGFFCNRLGIKFFVDHHDFIFIGHALNPRHWSIKSFFKYIEFRFFRRYLSKIPLYYANKIISVADVCTENLINYHKVDSGRIFTNKLAVDTDTFFFKKVDGEKIRRELNIDSKDFVLIFSGQLSDRKLPNLYLELVSQSKNVILIFLIVADSIRVDSLLNKAIELNVDERVRFVANIKQKDMYRYYSASDCSIWLANNSVAILEAMACSLPIIIPNLQLSYLVNKNGFLVNSGDVRGAVEKINLMIESKELVNRFSLESKELVDKHWSYKIFASKLIKLYKG